MAKLIRSIAIPVWYARNHGLSSSCSSSPFFTLAVVRLLEINGALNRPTTKFGVDYRLLGACLFVSIAIFLFASKVLACLLLPFLTGAGAWLTRQDPKMFHLWVLSFRLASHYDPGKE